MESIRMLWYNRGRYSMDDLRLTMMPYGAMVFAWRKDRGLPRLTARLSAPPGAYVRVDREYPPLSLS